MYQQLRKTDYQAVTALDNQIVTKIDFHSKNRAKLYFP